jgi:outer membrane protein
LTMKQAICPARRVGWTRIGGRKSFFFTPKLFLVGLFLTEAVYAQVANTAEPEPSVLPLSLKKAVEIALAPEGNARVQLALEAVKAAQARSAQTRALLLPNLDGSVGQLNQTRNLAALGIGFNLSVIGLQFPTFVGPFNTFDARASLTQSIFDFSNIRRFQATRAGIQQALAENDSTGDQTRELVAKSYLAALRSEAALETARSNVTLAEALLKLAENQKEVGTGTGIEVTRARVQLANERQRLLEAQNGKTRAHLELLRSMGLKLEVRVQLTETLTFQPTEPTSVEQSLKTALEERADWKAQQKREQMQNLNYSAAKMERLPSVLGLADYGTIGTSVNNAIPTYTYGVSVRVPVFDGGRRDARRAESLVLCRLEGIRTRDLKEQIEFEVRLALDSLQSAREQVKAAGEGLQLAEEELAQARRRYEGGVSNSLEVTDAQSRLARARENRIAAVFNHSLASLDLAAATGLIRRKVE